MQENASTVTVVGKTFDELVLNSQENVLLEVSRPKKTSLLLTETDIKTHGSCWGKLETGAHAMVCELRGYEQTGCEVSKALQRL